MSSSLRKLERRFDVAQYVNDRFPDRTLHDKNVSVTCPHCEKADKLWILIKEKVTAAGTQPAGSFICYYCHDVDEIGVGKGPLALIQWVDDVEYFEALRTLAHGADRESSVSFSEEVIAALREAVSAPDESSESPSEIALPDSFKLITEKRRPKYLRDRDISWKKAVRYRLGYCDGGYFRNRLIVPVYLDSKLVSFQARWMQKAPPTGVKKVHFPKGVKTQQMLFNYDVAREQTSIVITEDPFSAMAVGKRAVATFGTSLSAQQLNLLAHTDAEELIVAWDRDAIEKAYKLVQVLQEFWSVRLVEMPDARDLDDHTKAARRMLIDDAKGVDDFDVFSSAVHSRLSSLDL